MTDRELLEMAAKAAGYERNSAGPIGPCEWNPLEDDGDALRLAVRLGISVGPERPDVIGKSLCRASWRNRTHSHSLGEYGGGDEFVATRRAIVRAAAHIGAEKPTK